MSTLSNSNSVLMLQVTGLFPVPIEIQGFSVDDMFTVPDVVSGEFMMGVDGKLSYGYVPYEVPLELTLQADSESNLIFDTLIGAESISKDKYRIDFTILVQGTSTLYVFTNGALGTHSPIPAGKKVLQPRKFSMTYESIKAMPV